MAPFFIHIDNVGKQFQRKWLFREIGMTLTTGDKLVLTGSNGSGKSTLLRILAGQMRASEGRVIYTKGKMRISDESIYRHISWMGPYISLYPELNLKEHFELHFRFKTPLLPDASEFASALNLSEHIQKPLRSYSSGMLQRAKLGFALFSHSDVLFLDEPTANMDAQNSLFALELIQQYLGNRIYILASNIPQEYAGIDKKVVLG